MAMTTQTRRQFLKQTAVTVAGTAALASGRKSFGANANEKIVMGVIGPGGMGSNP
jgi:hypothetical protein